LLSVSIVFIILIIVNKTYYLANSKTNSIDTTIVYTNKKQKKAEKVKDFIQKPSDAAFIDAIDIVSDLDYDIPNGYVEIDHHG